MPGVSDHPQSPNPEIFWIPIGDGPDATAFQTALTGLPGIQDSPLDADVLHLLAQNVGRMVLLASAAELASHGVADLPAALRRFGIELVWRPIRSRPPPELMHEIVRWIREAPYRASAALTAATPRGRAAMVAACAIDAGGTGTNYAIGQVRGALSGDALRDRHLAAIGDYARFWRSLPPPAFVDLREIRNRDLSREMVPQPFAPWFQDMNLFALTMNAYNRGYPPEALGQLNTELRRRFVQDGNLESITSLPDARAALFGMQRAYNLEGDGPEPRDMPYLWALADAIRRLAK